MNSNEARAEVSRILEADLDALTGNGHLSLVPPVPSDAWDLPRSDKAMLWAHGLPGPRSDGRYGIAASYQSGKAPESEHGESRFYRLGVYAGVSHLAEQGTGRVVLPVPTAAEVHPQFAHRFPESRTFTLVNSSVARWIGLAWRWHWLVPILADQWIHAGEAELKALRVAAHDVSKNELPDFYAESRELRQVVLLAFRSRDPDAIASEEAFWWETVME